MRLGKVVSHNNRAFVIHALCANIKSIIMSYTYKGMVYSIKPPVKSISVNKNNVVFTDKDGAKLIKFTNVNESKSFLALIAQS